MEAAEEPWTEKWLRQLHAVISQRSSVVNWLLCGLRTLGTESGGEGFGTGALGRYTLLRGWPSRLWGKAWEGAWVKTWGTGFYLL